MGNKIILLVLSFLVLTCKNSDIDKKEKLLQFELFDPAKNSYVTKLPSGQVIFIGLANDGKIDHLFVGRDSGMLQLDFFNNGNLKSKSQIKPGGDTNGRVYFFYENTGNLDAYFNYVDDKKFGLAQEYYDTSANLKSQMMYNSNEKVVWHRWYGKRGEIIKEEGSLDFQPH